jgi:hypothetical protein
VLDALHDKLFQKPILSLKQATGLKNGNRVVKTPFAL